MHLDDWFGSYQDEVRTSSDKLLSTVPPSTWQSSYCTPKTVPSLSLELALSMIPDSEGDDVLVAPCRGELDVSVTLSCPVHSVASDEQKDVVQARPSGADCDKALGCASSAQEKKGCKNGTCVVGNGTVHSSLVETPLDVVNEGRIEPAANKDGERQNEQSGCCAETEPKGKGYELGGLVHTSPCVVADSDVESHDGGKGDKPIAIITVPSSSDQGTLPIVGTRALICFQVVFTVVFSVGNMLFNVEMWLMIFKAFPKVHAV